MRHRGVMVLVSVAGGRLPAGDPEEVRSIRRGFSQRRWIGSNTARHQGLASISPLPSSSSLRHSSSLAFHKLSGKCVGICQRQGGASVRAPCWFGDDPQRLSPYSLIQTCRVSWT
jgi:hypothetical protein